MLDTNTCIYIIKRKPPDVIERFKRMEISEVGISSITLSELLYGVSKSSRPEQNQLALTQFIAPLEILPSVSSNLFEKFENYGIGSVRVPCAGRWPGRQRVYLTPLKNTCLSLEPFLWLSRFPR